MIRYTLEAVGLVVGYGAAIVALALLSDGVFTGLAAVLERIARRRRAGGDL